MVPAVTDLPELPEAWVQWLATQASDTPAAGSRMDAEALLSHLEAAVELSPCLELISFCHTAAERMRAAGAGGRHDTMTGLVYRLVATCATGHHGWGSGREFLRQLWDVCVGDPSREDEYTRMFTTAAAKVATDWTDGPQLTDPCVTLFAGSMAAPTEPLDLARAGTDRDLARLVLDHQRGRVRFLSDIDRWATYGADEDTLPSVLTKLAADCDVHLDVLYTPALEEIVADVKTLPFVRSALPASSPTENLLYNHANGQDVLVLSAGERAGKRALDMSLRLGGNTFQDTCNFGGHPALYPLWVKNYILSFIRESILKEKGELCKK